jgi:hypothetical protein
MAGSAVGVLFVGAVFVGAGVGSGRFGFGLLSCPQAAVVAHARTAPTESDRVRTIGQPKFDLIPFSFANHPAALRFMATTVEEQESRA